VINLEEKEHKKEEHKPKHEEHAHKPAHHAHPVANHAVKNRFVKRVKKIKTERNILFVTTIVFLVLFVGALVLNINPSSTDGDVTTGSVTITLLSDARCPECDTTMLKGSLVELFPDAEFKELDYSEDEAKTIMEEASITLLPAVILSEDVKEHDNYAQIAQFVTETEKDLTLMIGASFDPEGEICANGVDDTGNGLIDCEDESCSSELFCALEKTEKPKIELFIMSHCPYGTQVEKGLLPVLDLLEGKVDFELKFCDYAMHGQKELNEQLNQYCIQENYQDKLNEYLYCFLEDETSSAACIEKLGFDQDTLDTCIADLDAEFKVTEMFNDQSTWAGGRFPKFNVDAEGVAKYNVGGSPTFILNGVSVPTGRSPAALLTTICMGFSEEPAECAEVLDTLTPSPGFGYNEGSAAASAAAQCG